MYNNPLAQIELANGTQEIKPVLTSNNAVVINGLGLQNYKYSVSSLDIENSVDFANFPYPRKNGKGFLGYYLKGKMISLGVTIKGSSSEDFQKNLDEFRKKIYQEQIYLDVLMGQQYRRIKVNCISHPLSIQHYNVTFLKTIVQFESLEPFFYDREINFISVLDKSSPLTYNVLNEGYAEIDPEVIISFKSASNVSEFNMTMGEKTIKIVESFSDNDTLIIDATNLVITKNGTPVTNWYGEFPTLLVDYTNIQINTDGSSSFDINIKYKKTYV